MSIQVTCPSGHVLRVKDKFAGLVGKCPHCQARVQIPDQVSDNEIADLIGPPPEDNRPLPPPEDSVAVPLPKVNVEPEVDESVLDDDDANSGVSLMDSNIIGEKKLCFKCQHKSPVWFASCSFCGTRFEDDLSEDQAQKKKKKRTK